MGEGDADFREEGFRFFGVGAMDNLLSGTSNPYIRV